MRDSIYLTVLLKFLNRPLLGNWPTDYQFRYSKTEVSSLSTCIGPVSLWHIKYCINEENSCSQGCTGRYLLNEPGRQNMCCTGWVENKNLPPIMVMVFPCLLIGEEEKSSVNKSILVHSSSNVSQLFEVFHSEPPVSGSVTLCMFNVDIENGPGSLTQGYRNG